MAGHIKDENVTKINIKVRENGLIAVKRPIDKVRRELAKVFYTDLEMMSKILETKELGATEKIKVEVLKFRMQAYLNTLKDDSAEKFKAQELYFKYKDLMDKQLGGYTVEEEDEDSPLLDFENIQDVN